MRIAGTNKTRYYHDFLLNLARWNKNDNVSTFLKCVPVFVNEGIESHAVSPAGAEVVDVDVGIAVKHTHTRTISHGAHVNTSFGLKSGGVLTLRSSSDTTAAEHP